MTPDHSGKVVVLNYHRVLPTQDCTSFYDVSDEAFAAQMRALADRVVDSTAGYLTLDTGLTVVLTFDDGTSDHVLVARQLENLDFTGTFFVVSGFVDTPDHLGSEEIRHMAEQGHRIGSHAVTHRRLIDLEDDVRAEELSESRRALEQLTSQPVDWFAPPGGFSSEALLSEAESAGYEVVRTMEWGYARRPVRGRTPCLPVLPAYDLKAFTDLIEGRAPLWRYKAKTLAKWIVGETGYVHLRNRLEAIRRRRAEGRS